MGGAILAVMPFGSIDTPPIGVSTMKAQIQNDLIQCDIAYLNLRFAQAIGYENYMDITNGSGETLIGEWMFASSLFGETRLNGKEFINDILLKMCGFPHEKVDKLLYQKQQVEPFLERCLYDVPWERYDIVGFTSMFEQNLAVLSLANRIKERFPDKIIVMGGANCAGPMGLQLHKSFPFLDVVFTGEADFSFPELVRRLNIKKPWQGHIKGCVWRDKDRSVESAPDEVIQDLDCLPYPNYDDYFEELSRSSMPPQFIHDLSIETSRGCWWGERNQCNFCGLNNQHIRFRAKSSSRALDEILHLATRYGIDEITAVDNILPLEYFKTLLPDLKFRRPGIRLFYETKANLTKERVKLLKDAGVIRIQPGIEAFSSNVLKLMHKGVSALQNVQLLKWCCEEGLGVAWNLLYGFPGENARDYYETNTFVKALTHLPPPMACGWIRAHRFSPLFESPQNFGVRDLRPLSTYQYIYPLKESERANLAYNFDFDFDGKEKTDRLSEFMRHEIERWKQADGQDRLEVVDRSKDYILVHDTRAHRILPTYEFYGQEKAIIEFCDDSRTVSSILDFLLQVYKNNAFSEAKVDKFLGYLVDHRLMLSVDERYLNLILFSRVSSRGACA